MQRELTGRHVFLITAGAFAVIIGANLVLAWQAVATFPGIEVRNGYVASQRFEADRRAQEALGWTAETRLAGGVLSVRFTGPDGGPAPVASVEGLLGRATSAADDRVPAFVRTGPATFEAPAALPRGQWVLHLSAKATDGTAFRQRVQVTVRE
ncbi:MAG: FixH family protein [Rhodobacteraceae bacterium]|nr:FixH family protein [Paracoccaceae bacterium]